MRFWLIRTKIVRKTLSEETKSAKMPNGKGSKAFTLGIKLRFTVLQTATKITCNSRNLGLPMNLTMASLWRSVRVRRSKASSSSFAIAAILNCVGLFEMWSGGVFFMQGGAPAHPGFTLCERLTTRLNDVKLLRTGGAGLCRRVRVRRINNNFNGAPTGIGLYALRFAESERLELRIIKSEIGDQV